MNHQGIPSPGIALLSFAVGLALLVAAPAIGAPVTGFKVLHQFSALTSRGLNPEAALIKGTDGNFYGTANTGGTYYQGTIFKITPAGALTVLYNFAGGDGSEPASALLEGSDGNFYGVTYTGGIGNGTVFMITPAGVLTTLHYFNGDDGYLPSCALVVGNDGNFYGTTKYGGSTGSGTVFKITPTGKLTTIYNFSDSQNGNNPNADGAALYAGVVKGSDGNFYGTTGAGGTAGAGTVFKVTPAGKLTVLHTFTAIDGNFVNSDGSNPKAALLLGKDGNFYGTTTIGGSGQAGTVFKITPAGVLTTFHPFVATDVTDPNNLGGEPEASLIQATDGNFYGTCSAGGANGGTGTLYRLTPAGAFTLLHSFGATDANGYNNDGSNVISNLVQGSDGNFYGTANAGGVKGFGTIFKSTPAGVLTLLYTCNGDNLDGATSSAALVQGADGLFYGTASSGGTYNNGTVFRIGAGGTLTTLHNFSATDVNEDNADGATPNDGLVLASDGNFYGTTQNGGAHHAGAIFKMTPAGAVTNLHSFAALNSNGANADGAAPFASLAQGRDGNLYGTATGGGTGGTGTIFKLTLSGVFTTLHSFGPFTNSDGRSSDGAFPEAALVQGTDGNFYGTSNKGGTGEYGTVFKITPAGAFTLLYTFPFPGFDPDGTYEGHSPESGLVEGADGNFYGTTSQAGANGNGTIFRVTPAGMETTLHNFTAIQDDYPIYDNTDGAVPVGTLIRRSDGYFYGTTSQGGANGNGTVFRMTPAGALTTLHSFGETDQDTLTNADGSFSLAGLLLGGDGNLYGTTYNQGSNTEGTIFTVTFVPVITSAKSVAAGLDKAFSYRITATGSPTAFAAGGLPKGLSVNAVTGLITGTPTAAGTYSVTLVAGNSAGKGSAVLTLTVGQTAAPTISSFTPASGPVDTLVVIHGTGFVAPLSVIFAGNVAAVHSFTATQVNAQVPEGALTGRIRVVTENGSVSTAANFTVTVPPTISSFSPAQGAIGSTVVIKGTGFVAPLSVVFAGNVAAVHGFTSTQINATVPKGASSGPIKVNTNGGSVSTASGFTVTSPPTITSFGPASGAVGSTVVINGTNFVAPLSVIFAGGVAAVHSFTATRIDARVPSGAKAGPIKVATSYGGVSTATGFTPD